MTQVLAYPHTSLLSPKGPYIDGFPVPLKNDGTMKNRMNHQISLGGFNTVRIIIELRKR
ncbi:MAG: hypothetical protein ACJATP_001750 [Candidatus Azotimanducaceae bacterium]|jgi:hypothetical protein